MIRRVNSEAINAVEWHSKIARSFDELYVVNKNFTQRFSIWTRLIDKYSNAAFHTLDVGCGTGIFSFYLARRNRHVLGIDASEGMYRLCIQKKELAEIPNIDFQKVDLNSLDPSLTRKMDLIICSSVLEYVDNFEKSFKVISSLMKANGTLIFSMPNHQSIYSRIKPVTSKLIGLPKHYRFEKNIFSLQEVERRVEGMGFRVLERAYLEPTPLLSLAFRRVGLERFSENMFILVTRKG